MQVKIKSLDVAMDVKSSGIEFEVRKPGSKEHLGDCFLTMTGLIWCEGRTTKQNGVKVSWSQFMEIMKSDAAKKAALKAAKQL